MRSPEHKTLGYNVMPESYRLKFYADLKTFKFRGEEEIEVRIKKPTRTIKINSVGLKIKTAKICVGKKEHGLKVSYNEKEGQAVLQAREPVKGKVTLKAEFEGKNSDNLSGFYRSKYVDKGRTGYMLTTQFEPADARAAFPCFDEPEFKATFSVTIIADKGLDALSNMPAESEAIKSNKKATQFAATPRMSTYLLYLGVGKFDYLERDFHGVKLRIITTPGKKSMSRLAMGYLERCLAFYNGYFGIKYPLPKLDLIAVPDFAAGAMENWGAITFRDTALLADYKGASIFSRQRIASVIAHELAHQWFGDLVTMRWWDDLWLNESFATFMAAKAVDAMMPEWKMMLQYFDSTIAAALAADQYKATHPISVKVDTPAEVNQIFDRISYEKGGSVLYMLENYVGKEVFRKGLSDYLSRHKYSNATKHDLWESIGRESRKVKYSGDVPKVIENWVETTGYPVVSASLTKNGLKLEQERFLINGRERRTTWKIPLIYSIGDGAQRSALFYRKAMNVRLSGNEPVKINKSQAALYRVNYDDRLLERLGSALKSKTLKGQDAWGIENDLFALARSGRITVRKYIDFVMGYMADSDYPANSSIKSHLNWLDGIFFGTKFHGQIQKVNLAYNRSLIAKLGWKGREGEDSIFTMLRPSVILTLGLYGDKKAAEFAESGFKDILSGRNVDPNMKGSIYQLSVWNDNGSRWNSMVKMYKSANTPEDQKRILGSLGMYRSKKLVNKALKFATSKDVRPQDIMGIPYAASGNPYAKDALVRWTISNWGMFRKRYEPGTHMMPHIVENLSMVNDKRNLNSIRHFFTGKRITGDIRMSVMQTFERIEANVNLLKKNESS